MQYSLPSYSYTLSLCSLFPQDTHRLSSTSTINSSSTTKLFHLFLSRSNLTFHFPDWTVLYVSFFCSIQTKRKEVYDPPVTKTPINRKSSSVQRAHFTSNAPSLLSSSLPVPRHVQQKQVSTPSLIFSSSNARQSCIAAFYAIHVLEMACDCTSMINHNDQCNHPSQCISNLTLSQLL